MASFNFASVFPIIFHAGNAGLDDSILFRAVLGRLAPVVFSLGAAMRFIERFLPLFFVVGGWLAIGMSVVENIEKIRLWRAKNLFAISRMVERCGDCFIR